LRLGKVEELLVLVSLRKFLINLWGFKPLKL
jgi:hypothetical protein